MNEHVQIAYFFRERNIYNPTKVANSFLEIFPELGHPVILPFNIGPNEEDIDIPVVIFNQCADIQLTLTFGSVIITLFNNKRAEKLDVLQKFFEIVEKFDFNFSRIGYVNNILMPESESVIFKNEKFKDSEIINAKEFQLAWFNKIEINGVNINYWQRFNTNKLLTNDIFVGYDLNTLVEEKLNITYDFSVDFINRVDDFLNL